MSSDDGIFKRFLPFTKNRVGKKVKSKSGKKKQKRSKREKDRMQESLSLDEQESLPLGSPPISPMVTLIVGSEQRVFAAHEDALSRSPFFNTVLRDQYWGDSSNKVVDLSDEEPEILSCILEFLYKGDYYPHLLHNKEEDTWRLEQDTNPNNPGGQISNLSTIFLPRINDLILRDTVIYCAAEKYGLEDLKSLSLRKQGLQSAIPVDVILRSARYAYDHTPDSDSRLRAHYLAMIIRTRRIFKRSGTMQVEMERGHEFFFDLFVAMCNHMDDLGEARKRSPKPT